MKRARPTRLAGFSLIELLVAMAIGLIVTLAITSVLIRGESAKRNSTSVNDLNQSGAYAAYVLDRVIRSAGSGFSQSWPTTYGCLLSVAQGGTAILPTTIPTTSTFKRVTQPFRLAPVIIGKGLADSSAGAGDRGDVLVVMGGTAGFSEFEQTVSPGSVSAASMTIQNALGYRTNDLVLLADPAVAGGCMMQQVAPAGPASSPSATLPFGGTTNGATTTYYGGSATYVATTSSPVPVTAFGGSTIALQMGNAANNPPRLELYGVGPNRALMSYDLMRPSAPDTPIADGVLEMRALYGISSTATPGNTVDTWVDATGDYAASVLTNGSAASQKNLRRILAVRVGLILRTSLQERPPRYVGDPDGYQLPAGTVLTLFGDLGGALPQTRTLTTGELNYRYRIVESTIPLRNVLLAPQS
jgi:type IV pilus assembly protein PilW